MIIVRPKLPDWAYMPGGMVVWVPLANGRVFRYRVRVTHTVIAVIK